MNLFSPCAVAELERILKPDITKLYPVLFIEILWSILSTAITLMERLTASYACEIRPQRHASTNLVPVDVFA